MVALKGETMDDDSLAEGKLRNNGEQIGKSRLTDKNITYLPTKNYDISKHPNHLIHPRGLVDPL